MYVGSIRKEEPRARTTPQEKPLPPVLAQRSLLLPENCGRQRLSVSLADGERNTKGRPDVHPLG